MFFSVIVPVMIIFLAGYVAQRIFRLDIKSVSTLAIYLMFPPLVFRNFYEHALSMDHFFTFVYMFSLIAILIAIIKFIGWWRTYPDSKQNALILSAAFMNNGNYGLPLVLFAYGTVGITYVVPIMIFHTILQTTLGVYYAAKGRTSLFDLIMSIIKMPMMHAVYLGICWRIFSLPMHDSVYGAISMIADAAIPTIMLALGLQLAEIKLKNIEWNYLYWGVFLRLILSPLLAIPIVWFMPVDILLKKIMILMAATPTAAFSVMLSIQYDCDPQLVSAVTLLTTLLSMGSILAILLLLG